MTRPDDWRPTGWSWWKRGWFGRVTLQVQERRRVFRPVCAGHSPANWQEQIRWRAAQRGDRAGTIR